MERQIITSEDGSSTLFVPALNEHYHSTKGAVQESEHVFIRSGLAFMHLSEIRLFEVGFGTGLNAWLTALWAEENQVKVEYLGLEKYPLSADEVSLLNYPVFKQRDAALFNKLHICSWNQKNPIHSHFSLYKVQADLLDYEPEQPIDLCYFDAFGPDKQPALWEEMVFTKLSQRMSPGAVLVTYSAKGSVRRALKSAGFCVEKLPGPPGKREITRAIKI